VNARDTMLSLIYDSALPTRTPAGFFMHFDASCHQGQAAIDQHMAFYRATGMDFVKVQYEQHLAYTTPPRTAEDWRSLPRLPDSFFEPAIQVAEGLVRAARGEALVLMTLYSPFMWARHLVSDAELALQIAEHPEAVASGLEVLTEHVLTLARGCMRAGVDGFYASSQGGEAFRFPGASAFERLIKPSDLAVWAAIQPCACNILHICDYVGGYDDLTPFLDYPGHAVNCSLRLGDRELTPREAAQLFGRPFMGGMERKGLIATGNLASIRAEAERVLAMAPDRFILAADCTVPSETPWENLRAAVDSAHQHRR
jgi:uroporphyrinogen decarboxylase